MAIVTQPLPITGPTAVVPPAPPVPPTPPATPATPAADAAPVVSADTENSDDTDSPDGDKSQSGITITADGDNGKGSVKITVDGKTHELSNGAEHLAQTIQHEMGTDDMPIAETVAAGCLGAIGIIFTLFVLPIWLFLHYKGRHRPLAAAPSHAPNTDLNDLARLADRLENRLDALEALMDAERPSWRK